MNGQTKNYRKSLAETPYMDTTALQRIRIDYAALVSYARAKGVSPSMLSDDEKDMFISNSSMSEIYALRRELS